uniref:Piezo type mechanosensitive ion channel component 1 (Er blood group) n=1 Tax=Paramormyrops kingsleyae TaxID=1676925 RepID=A0A3B3S5A2_9TELE
MVRLVVFTYARRVFVFCLVHHLVPSFTSFNEASPACVFPAGHTGRFTKALLCTSLLFLLAHLTFQICLHTIPGLDNELGHNCSSWETLTHHIGVSRLPLNDHWMVLRLITPDLGVFLASLVTLILGYRLMGGRDKERELEAARKEEHKAEEDEEEDELGGDEECQALSSEPEESPPHAMRTALLAARIRTTALRLLRDLARVLAVVLLALAGITLPSAFSAVYYLLFIGICTWWACHFPISRLGFNALCVMVGFYTAGHLVCLYMYQSSYAQGLIPPASLWARLFGLKAILNPGNCSSFSYEFTVNTDHEWPVFANPGILLLLYFAMAMVEALSSSRMEVIGTGMEQVELRSRGSQRKADQDDSKEMLLTASPMPRCESENTTGHIINGSSQQDLDLSGAPTGPDGDNPLLIAGRMIMQQSYVCALIAMMVWSITYHSWLTFVLLLWACLIWMVRARRHFATLCSPFILLYGLSLCSLQYVWGMELELELPHNVGTMSLKQLGLDRTPHPCLRLGPMLLYTLTFWLLLRQSVKDNFSRKKISTTPLQEVTTGENAGQSESILKVLGEMAMSFYAKYWIYVCGGMFIMVSFAGKLVGYKIVYMLIFLLCLCLYQVYYSLWRKLLKVFWWLVVAYTMLVLIAIYTFQFEDFPAYWKNFTGFTEKQLAVIGLETFQLSELFTSILIPGFFLLACILQLHYFHKPFMKITDLENVTPIHKSETLQGTVQTGFEEENQETDLGGDDSEDEGMIPSKWGLVMDRLMVLFRKFSEVQTQVQAFIWRVLELHILKIVAFFIIWVALLEPSVMNLVLVVLWAFAMPYSRFRHMASCLSTVWVCIIIVCKMLYQLSVVNPVEYSSNCTLPFSNETNMKDDELLNSTLYKEPIDPANWFGFRKEATALGYSKNHLLVLMLLVFEATVYRHQTHHYKQHQCSPPPIPVIFPNANRDNLDQDLLTCIKYLFNFTFYKFGLEICFLMTVNVIGQRMNFVVIIHGCWLVIILTRRQRAAIAKIWPKYCLFLVFFMIYQYILCVGIPPVLCIDYPWRWKSSITISSNLIKWIYLPDFYTIPNSRNLIADFLLLICASQQWKIFLDEKKEEWMVFGGENTDKSNPMEDRPVNPVPNYINCRCYLDMAKVLVFRHMFWFVLAVVFVTGATRISIFGLGYLLACFYFLLFGTQLLIKPARTRLVLWDCLIMYNVAILTLLSYMLPHLQESFCWVIQLFSLVCTVKGYDSSNQECVLPVEEAGIIWDSICFFFLLLQRRVFLSFYFLHVTADLQASALQASKGFELFRASIVKNMRFHQQAEQLLHSGDYYLFESDSEEEEESVAEDPKPPRQSAFQVRVWTYDIVQKILDILRFLWVLLMAMVDGLTQWLNVLTKQYVDTSTVLCYQRYFHTHNQKLAQEPQEDQVSQGSESPTMETCLDELDADVSTTRYMWTLYNEDFFLSSTTLCSEPTLELELEPDLESQPSPRYRHCRTASELLTDRRFFVEELVQSQQFYSSQNRALKFLFALYNLLAANSELVCYFIIVLNNLVTASVISLVLPILIFLWAMLAVPRPTKKFWMTAIVFTEVMVVVKYMFQFGFFPWNSAFTTKLNEDKPFFPSRILGVEKTDNYIRYDLLQLLVLFFHRSLLQRYGLWDREGALEEEKSQQPQEGGGEEARPLVSPEQDTASPEGVNPHEDKTAKPEQGQEEGVLSGAAEALPEEPEARSKSSRLHFRRRKKQSKDAKDVKEPKRKPAGKRKEAASRKLKAVGEGFKRLFISLVRNTYTPVHGFFHDILHAEYRAATDVYALMFLTDVVDFIIIVFGFWAFGKHSAAADIASSLSEDQVPEAFLVMLLIQFSTMIIDRALYLRKTVLGKLIFQIILVFGIHIWMFFILPAVTERMFSQNSVAQLWYFVKCIYFALSAYQIRCGYPTRILGNFLTKKYNHLNLFLFQGFRLVPFLVELRAVMDWVWTDTTLSLSNWMCVEDIYANTFIIKCSRETEKKYPQRKGQKKKKIVKYGMGGLIIVFLICIIWFPLLFISLVRSVVGVVNHPVDVTVTVKLGGYEPLFTMSVQQQSIQPYTEDDYNKLSDKFSKNAVAMQFISLYSYEDVVTANIEGSSGSVWRISPPSRQEVIKELLGSPMDMTLRLTWDFQRDLGKGGTVEHTSDTHSIDLAPDDPVRAELASLLVGNRSDPVLVPHMFPNYIRAPNGAEAKPVSQLYEGDEEGYESVTLTLLNGSGTLEWWDISIAGCSKFQGGCQVLPMVIFNDKVSPPSLGFLAGYGIMGLYVSVVLVIGKFVRGFFSEISHSIMFEELPCVDRILKLCNDIFLVRETGDLELEEELYAKLIFLYRSPETMIKWTREKD